VGLIIVNACSGDGVGPSVARTTHLRIVNSVFQAGVSDTVAIPIDYLIDSALTRPSVLNLTAANVSSSDSANGYASLIQGVHSYVVRRVGDTSFNASMYTDNTSKSFLPKVYLTGDTYYTIIVAGVVPATGDIPKNTVPFIAIVDDPFPGPTYHNTLQARFRVINAAPFADPSGGNSGSVNVYVTRGDSTPSDISAYVPLGYANYRDGSSYINVDAGTYTVTLVSGGAGAIVAQQAVTFAAGEIRTLVLQSTAAGAPSTENHVLRNILDHQY